MSIELKIKEKHLALEPGIIRCEEEKLKEQIKYNKDKLKDTGALVTKLWSLGRHRRWDVCNETRATHLARTYLAGKPYTYAEKKRKQDRESRFQYSIIPRIVAMVKKYGIGDQLNIDDNKIRAWARLE